MLAPGVRWHDDWHAVETLAPGLHAIGEPWHHYINWSYVIEGRDRALLFDTGVGIRDMRPVVESLVSRPVIALPSHLHFDHTGSLHRFDRVAMADLPVLRRCVRDGVLHAPEDLFLGSWEDMTWKPVKVSDWLPIGTRIDLGGRCLELFHTPGHSPDSVSLLDREANILFAADLIYPGSLYAQVPGSNLEDYLQVAQSLLPHIGPATTILCGHGIADRDGLHAAPRLNLNDLMDLHSALQRLKASGEMPEESRVNDRMTLLANPDAFAAWQRPK